MSEDERYLYSLIVKTNYL